MDAVKPVLDLISGFGVAAPAIGLLLWLYWQERTERRELVEKVMNLTTSQMKSEQDLTAAINLLAAKVTK